MHHRTSNILTVGICLLVLTVASPSKENDAVASSAYEGLMDTGVSTVTTVVTALGSTVQSQTGSAGSCLPSYGEPQFILSVRDADEYEPELDAGDFNADGLDDVLIRRSRFQSLTTYELDVLLNNGNGGLVLGTSSVFSGTVPRVQFPSQIIITDFNGDKRPDIFVPDQGMDAEPFPGYQNTLVLSLPGGRLVDATANLPQQNDYTHSAAAGDIDGDGDNDLYLGNLWGQHILNPQILVNDGSGKFTVGENRLHESLDLLTLNGYTACEFVDVNKDGSPDLVLADAGGDINDEDSWRDSVLLLNDGFGYFTSDPITLPAKPFTVVDIGIDIQPTDLDRDGYQDLLIAYTKVDPFYQGRYIQVLINNQNNTFRDETAARLPQSDNNDPYVYRLQLMDFDRDQDMDLIARRMDTQNPDPLLFLNDGNGHFSRKLLDFKLPYIHYAFLDLDGDDGRDLVYATYAPPEDIYTIRDLGCPVFLPLVFRNWSAGN